MQFVIVIDLFVSSLMHLAYVPRLPLSTFGHLIVVLLFICAQSLL
jgi:hypothetical protein